MGHLYAANRLDEEGSSKRKQGIYLANCKSAMVYLHRFQKHPGHNKYRYVESDCVWIDVDAIISTLSLSYSAAFKIYTLDEVDANSLAEFVRNQR